MISREQSTTAHPATVHALLVDVDSWSLWSPHVSSVEARSRRLHEGWQGDTRAFFAPRPTSMIVDEIRPDGGYRWHSSVGPWTLRYDNRVDAEPGGATVRFAAELEGPAARLLERLVAPLSSLGQRRRIQRLTELAELVERQGRS